MKHIICGECGGSGVAEYIDHMARPCDGCHGNGCISVHWRHALAIEAASAGETVKQGSTEGESAGPKDNAQNPSEVSGD